MLHIALHPSTTILAAPWQQKCMLRPCHRKSYEQRAKPLYVPLYCPHTTSHLAQFSPMQGSQWLEASSAKVATRATADVSVAAYALQYRSALIAHHFPTKSAKKENHATQIQHAAMRGISHLQWCRRLSQLKRLPQHGHDKRELSISQALSPGRSWRDISISCAAVSG